MAQPNRAALLSVVTVKLEVPHYVGLSIAMLRRP